MREKATFASRTGIKPGRIMNVNFEWGGLTEEMKKERIKKIQENVKKYSFWVKVRLVA